MHEMNPLEKQLQSWTPRRPSAKLATRIFAVVAPAPVLLRRADLWRWLTPAAACALALLVVAQASERRWLRGDARDTAASFATLIFKGASNVQPAFVFNKTDANVEWNIWPHPIPALAMIPTNH